MSLSMSVCTGMYDDAPYTVQV